MSNLNGNMQDESAAPALNHIERSSYLAEQGKWPSARGPVRNRGRQAHMKPELMCHESFGVVILLLNHEHCG